jgi:adenylate cyclase
MRDGMRYPQIDPEQEYFCDGLVEDIITTLSKLDGLRVIARNSSFVYKGRSVDVREAAQQLGVRYVLEGSVRRSGARIRVTAQLIDAADGSHLWAERYDRAVDDIFAIQDEITLMLATEMQVKLTDGEQARMHYTTTSNVEAWTYWAKGMSYFRQPPTRDNREAAQAAWEKALALDPNSAPLNAMLGFTHCLDARFGWKDSFDVAHAKARRYAEKALELDPSNADAHITSGMVLLMEGRHDEAVADARKAVRLAPGSADVAQLAGFIVLPSGYAEEAIALCEKSISLSPNFPTVYLGALGDAYRQAGRTDDAIATFEAYNARNPGFGLTDLVIAHQEKGQPEEAKRTAARLMAARPEFTIAGLAQNPVHSPRRRAGRSRRGGPPRRRTSAGMRIPQPGPRSHIPSRARPRKNSTILCDNPKDRVSCLLSSDPDETQTGWPVGKGGVPVPIRGLSR